MEKKFVFLIGDRILIAEWSDEYGGEYRSVKGTLMGFCEIEKNIAEVKIDGFYNNESTNGYFYFKLSSLIQIDKNESDKVLIGNLNTGYSFVTNKEYEEIRMKNELTKKEQNDIKQNRPFVSLFFPNKRMVEIEKVIFNNPATIVFWNDGSKTVVKCSEDECFDEEKGLAMAISKKEIGRAHV